MARRAAGTATLVRASDVDDLLARNVPKDRLEKAPVPSKRPHVGPDGRYHLTRSVHAPASAICSGLGRVAPRPSNPLAPAFRRRYGLAAPADNKEVQLAPIRLSLDLEHQKVRETFTWNLNDGAVPVPIFARQLVSDLEVAEDFVPLIAEAMESQIQEYATVMQLPLAPRCTTIQLEASNHFMSSAVYMYIYVCVWWRHCLKREYV